MSLKFKDVEQDIKSFVQDASEFSDKTGMRWDNIQTAANFLIAKELRDLNSHIETLIEAVHSQADNTKTQAMIEIEERFGKPISELLSERKDKSVREVATELGVSKSTIFEWRRQFVD